MVLAGRRSYVLADGVLLELMGQKKTFRESQGRKVPPSPFRLRHPIPTAFPPVDHRTAKTLEAIDQGRKSRAKDRGEGQGRKARAKDRGERQGRKSKSKVRVKKAKVKSQSQSQKPNSKSKAKVKVKMSSNVRP